MNARLSLLGVCALASAVACSSTHADTELASRVSSAIDPSILRLRVLPINIVQGVAGSAWTGTRVDLMVADALAQCATADGRTFNDAALAYPATDMYLSGVGLDITSAYCTTTLPQGVQNTSLAQWYYQRRDPNCSFDDVNGAVKQGYMPMAPLAKSTIAISVPSLPNVPSTTIATAEYAVERARINLCIAQQLRLQAPGASSGEALLLAAEEQRRFAEVIRERSQLAMLQFAGIALWLATPPSPNDTNGVGGGTGFVLQHWAADNPSDLQLAQLGADFTHAVNLHVASSREIASLLVRSSDAHLPRGGTSMNAADELWGAGSWRTRAMAALFGGDPLAVGGDASAPWKGTIGQAGASSYPGYADAFHSYSLVNWNRWQDWADTTENPIATVSSSEPQVHRLESLARKYNALFIKLPSATLDPDASAARLYLAVEAALRTTNCVQVDPGAVCHTFIASDIAAPRGDDPAQALAGFELWNRERITMSHAVTLLRQLAQAVGNPDQRGANNYRGTISRAIMVDELGQNAMWIHISPETEFTEKGLKQQAPLYSRFGRYFLPDHVEPLVSDNFQGLQAAGEASLASVMGAVPALVATRGSLMATKKLRIQDSGFFASRPNILNLINAAVGYSSVGIRPSTFVPTPIAGVPFDTNATDVQQPAGHWIVDVTAKPTDPWWAANGSYALYAVPDNPSAGTLAAHPGSLSPSATSIDCALVNPAGPPCAASVLASAGVIVSSNPTYVASPSPEIPNMWRFDVYIPANPLYVNMNQSWTLVVKRNTTPATYTLLADSLRINTALYTHTFITSQGTWTDGVHEPTDGQYIGYGGTLGALAQSFMSHDGIDPTRPAFDAFGLPTRWAPPTAPQLYGGMASDDAVVHYVNRARDEATQATAQVKDTLDELVKEALDNAQLAAAITKSAEVSKLENRELCGDQHADCQPQIVSGKLDLAKAWNDYSPTGFSAHDSFDAAQAKCVGPITLPPSGYMDGTAVASRLQCIVLAAVVDVPTLRLFKDVWDRRYELSVPTFSDYEGGTLQKALVQQWTAVRKVLDSLREMLAAVDAAATRSQTMAVVVEQDQQRWDSYKANRCSPFAMAQALYESVCVHNGSRLNPWSRARQMLCQDFQKAIKNGVPFDRGMMSDSLQTWDDEAGESYGESSGNSYGLGVAGGNVGFSTGSSSGTSEVPSAQRRRLCEDLKNKLSDDQWQALSGSLEAYATLAAKAAGFVDTVGTVVAATADGAALIHHTELAKARQKLEADQLQAAQLTTLKLYRQVHSYDVWRSLALLDSARVAAVAARRVIEAHFAVDLSKLSSPEAFVASPATWADDVYAYDLDMPAAVGLSVGQSQPGGVYANRVLDYVENLSRFVNGFAVTRPTAAAADTEVLTLPGPTGLVTGMRRPATNALDGGAAAWSYECPTGGSSAWLPMPNDRIPAHACGNLAPAPTRARLAFSLDPWGRVNGDVANMPSVRRYNARWTKLAVNLVGTGVISCVNAADPSACYDQPFLRYSLSRRGPAWVTDWNQSWLVLGVPNGRIEGAKALGAEQWIDPIQNGWGKPYVDAVARTELTDMPFGGVYELVFELAPEVVLERIDRVQILAGSAYWVKQD